MPGEGVCLPGLMWVGKTGLGEPVMRLWIHRMKEPPLQVKMLGQIVIPFMNVSL